MASRIIKKFKLKEFIFLAIVLASFVLVLGKYLFPQITNYINIRKVRTALSVKLEPATSCSTDQVKIQLTGGVLCRDEASSSIYLSIFDTYPLDPDGKEQIFPFINIDNPAQTIAIANDYLNNEYYVDRYNPVAMKNVTWDEDPYNQQYWRFIFYSLRDEEYLIAAWQETGNPAYKDKFIDIVQSFLTSGVNQPHAWDDSHAVAYRTMVLVDAWWELREYNALPVSLSTEILQSLEQNGAYLADPTHYNAVSNHGVNESAALLLLSNDFPDLPEASDWKTLSEDHLATGLVTLVDSDGVLIENSPYYHFYTLEKYWQIFQWTKDQGLIFAADEQTQLQKMINYATYILEPNDQIPIWGASLQRTVHFAGVDKDIALANPNFMYVLTQGKQGTQPPQLSIHYATAGETIMRSGWGTGSDFTNQTQVIFNVGPYRTNHSQLDALALTVYGQGLDLLPGPGLYTYASSTEKNYFSGTASHDTVVVDGQDQNQGAAVAGAFQQGNGYTYQTGESSLYQGVTHDRAVALLGQNLVLVVDHLTSDQEHTYSQMFHLFPGAQIRQNGIDITGYNGNLNSNQQITIHQLSTTGMTVSSTIGQNDPMSGFCSRQYNVLIPCYQIAYTQSGMNANFVTLLEIGKPSSNLHAQVSQDGNTVTITDGGKSYTVNIGDLSADTSPVQISNNNLPAPTSTEVISDFTNSGDWQEVREAPNDGSSLTFATASTGSELDLKSPTDGKLVQAERNVPLDLSDKNIEMTVNVKNAADLQSLELRLSNDNWKSYATIRLDSVYPASYSGQWATISLGKGELRSEGSEWTFSGNFDWSKIDQVAFTVASLPGTSVTLRVNNFSLIPQQSQGAVVIVFDAGYSSILSAADVMQSMGLKGNIGAVSQYIASSKVGYLGLSQLQNLQNEYGWDIINESWSNNNEVSTYPSNDTSSLSQDILEGAQYLSSNDLNSDPDWFIYPYGSTDPTIQSVVGQYYKFARTAGGTPEVYPFGNPLAVTTFSNISNSSTSPESVMKAIYDAKKYDQTLFLTFRQIRLNTDDAPGYPLVDFEEIMNYIVQQKINVDTFAELDQSEGVSINDMQFGQNKPEQISLQIVIHTNIFQAIWAFISSKI